MVYSNNGADTANNAPVTCNTMPTSPVWKCALKFVLWGCSDQCHLIANKDTVRELQWTLTRETSKEGNALVLCICTTVFLISHSQTHSTSSHVHSLSSIWNWMPHVKRKVPKGKGKETNRGKQPTGAHDFSFSGPPPSVAVLKKN